jgi:GPH family glycoside/pentoside/hexuronide:cation symporter
MERKDSLSTRTRLLFSTGDLSTSIPLTIIMFFQLFFLTDVAGLRPDYAGWAIAIGRVWDAINDPLFGQISDRIRSRFGRRRVVLLWCAVPLGITFALMWFVPPFSPLGLVAYYSLVFILFDSFFTFIHVSYNSLTPEMTRDYDERSSLNGFRMVYSIGGGLLSIILATVLGWFITDRKTLFTIIALGLGLVSIIPPFIVFAVTKDRDIAGQPEALSIPRAIRETLANRDFWRVMALYLFSWTTASILAAVLVYFANYYLRVPEQANYFVLISQVSAIAFVPFWVWAARKLDKRRAFILGVASWMVVLVGISLIHPEQVALAYILAACSGSGIATAYVLPWAMIPDIIEQDELRTGQRREGSYYAFVSFFQKLGTGLALWGMGQALALAILMAARYSITRESHQAMLDLLATKKEEV